MIKIKRRAVVEILLLVIVVSAGAYYFSLVSRSVILKASSGKIAEMAEQIATSSEPAPYKLADFIKVRQRMADQKMDFLEIDIPQMKVRVYKKGQAIKKAPILAKGDPELWSGTPSGLYKIRTKRQRAFSSVSEVYMPWAVQLYGKYYLHGEPYYPGGYELDSNVSGGCIRVKNEQMKEIYSMVERKIPVLIISEKYESSDYAEPQTNPPQVSSQSYLIADLDSGTVLAEKNPDQQLPMASLTKLMTAVVVAENTHLVDKIRITSEMTKATGSTEKIEAGKTFTLAELLYPLLIESSNDAAEALAGFLGREKTLGLMNEKTSSIMMSNTSFADPSGLSPKNVSTARDLYYLGRYIFNNRPPLLEITKGKKVPRIGEVSFDYENLWNKNKFIYDPNFVGGKTGYTSEAGHTALFIFQLSRNGDKHNVLFTLLNSSNVERDTQKLYLWLLDNYFKKS